MSHLSSIKLLLLIGQLYTSSALNYTCGIKCPASFHHTERFRDEINQLAHNSSVSGAESFYFNSSDGTFIRIGCTGNNEPCQECIKYLAQLISTNLCPGAESANFIDADCNIAWSKGPFENFSSEECGKMSRGKVISNCSSPNDDMVTSQISEILAYEFEKIVRESGHSNDRFRTVSIPGSSAHLLVRAKCKTIGSCSSCLHQLVSGFEYPCEFVEAGQTEHFGEQCKIKWKMETNAVFYLRGMQLVNIDQREWFNDSLVHLVNDIDDIDTFRDLFILSQFELSMNFNLENSFTIYVDDERTLDNLTEKLPPVKKGIAADVVFRMEHEVPHEITLKEDLQIDVPPKNHMKVHVRRKSFYAKFKSIVTLEYRDRERVLSDSVDGLKYFYNIQGTVTMNSKEQKVQRTETSEIKKEMLESRLLNLVLMKVQLGHLVRDEQWKQRFARVAVQKSEETKLFIHKVELDVKMNLKKPCEYKIKRIGNGALGELTALIDYFVGRGQVRQRASDKILAKLKGGPLQQFNVTFQSNLNETDYGNYKFVWVDSHHIIFNSIALLESDDSSELISGSDFKEKFILKVFGDFDFNLQAPRDHQLLSESQLSNSNFSLRQIEMTRTHQHEWNSSSFFDSTVHLINQRKVATSFLVPQVELEVIFTFDQVFNLTIETVHEEALNTLMNNMPVVEERVQVSLELAKKLKGELFGRKKIKIEREILVVGGNYVQVTFPAKLYHSKFKSLLMLTLDSSQINGWLEGKSGVTQVSGWIEFKLKTSNLGQEKRLNSSLN